ncbi:SPFH domain-containing protein [Streptomyces sp. NPDC093093]|uniref:SPFH domain-containing protein n=1 Tax=Streptomyces sp. NPDC093093 TaxID=3366025 RepID=UPI0037F15714
MTEATMYPTRTTSTTGDFPVPPVPHGSRPLAAGACPGPAAGDGAIRPGATAPTQAPRPGRWTTAPAPAAAMPAAAAPAEPIAAPAPAPVRPAWAPEAPPEPAAPPVVPHPAAATHAPVLDVPHPAADAAPRPAPSAGPPEPRGGEAADGAASRYPGDLPAPARPARASHPGSSTPPVDAAPRAVTAVPAPGAAGRADESPVYAPAPRPHPAHPADRPTDDAHVRAAVPEPMLPSPHPAFARPAFAHAGPPEAADTGAGEPAPAPVLVPEYRGSVPVEPERRPLRAAAPEPAAPTAYPTHAHGHPADTPDPAPPAWPARTESAPPYPQSPRDDAPDRAPEPAADHAAPAEGPDEEAPDARAHPDGVPAARAEVDAPSDAPPSRPVTDRPSDAPQTRPATDRLSDAPPSRPVTDRHSAPAVEPRPPAGPPLEPWPPVTPAPTPAVSGRPQDELWPPAEPVVRTVPGPDAADAGADDVADLVARAVARGMADADEDDTRDLPRFRPAQGASATAVPVHLPFLGQTPAGPPAPAEAPAARRSGQAAHAPRPAAGRRVPRGDDRLREHRGPVLPGWIAVAVGGLALAGCSAVLWRAGAIPDALAAGFGAAPRAYQGLRATHWPPLAFLGIVTLLALGGLGRAKAGHAWVLTLFGSYRGTVRRTGLTWVSPLLLRRRVDVRLRHWRSDPMPAVDSGGLALQVVVQVVWQVKDTARATLAVGDHTEYLAEQVESAMARVLSQLPADAFHDDAPTLRDAEAVGDALTRMLAAETEAVGVEVFSAQPTRIEYAPEVAEAMRRRRIAAIDARHRDAVLSSVVDAVDDTVHRLTSRGIVELDDYERKALVKDLTVAFYTGRSDQ